MSINVEEEANLRHDSKASCTTQKQIHWSGKKASLAKLKGTASMQVHKSTKARLVNNR